MNRPYVTKAEMRDLRAAGFRRTPHINKETGFPYRQWCRGHQEVVFLERGTEARATFYGERSSVDISGGLGELVVALPRAREALKFLEATMAEAPLAVKRADAAKALRPRRRRA